MKPIVLFVEYYRSGELVWADLFDSAVADDEFVYTDSFKVKISDTRIEENACSIYECEHRTIVVDDMLGKDSRFVKIS